MTVELVLLVCAAVIAATWLTWVVRRKALKVGLLDHPNARSSHTTPTPRGGGLSIVVVSLSGLIVLWALRVVDIHLALALLGGGIPVAIVGYLDDRHSLPVLVRIAVHFASAAWAVGVLGGLPPLQWGSAIVDMGILGDVFAVLGIVWTLNLFNFMDGIDGIAASECVFVTVAAAGLLMLTGVAPSVQAAALLVGAATIGFLIWNWPPARIFMGDVGSGYLGFVLAVLALGATRESGVMLYVWLVLGGVFFVDATVTISRRLARRERVFEAHRTHAYQWLSRRWRSHAPVTIAVTVVNVVWLLPCAVVTLIYPRWAGLAVLVAFLPLMVAAAVCGAGRREVPARRV